MSTELGDRLRDLADDAPPLARADGLWRRGMRRHRRRRAAGVLAVLAAVVVIGGGIALVDDRQEPPPSTPPRGEGHLPRTLYRPSAWSAGTAEAGEIGPLAAIGWAQRKEPEGLRGTKESLAPYGVSAIDGTVRFLDVPELNQRADRGTIVAGVFARLSPDGTKLGFVLVHDHDDDNADRLAGWMVYDTVTGKVTRLDDPDRPQQAPSLLDVAFTGDSDYLITSYDPSEPLSDRSHALVAWEIATGRRIVLEKPGRYWLPNLGSGPGGAVWSQRNLTYRHDPATGAHAVTATPRDVVMASVAPDGVGFAYFGGTLDDEGISVPWTFYAGPSADRLRRIGGIGSGVILGWRDRTHVVVGLDEPHEYAAVDITDGSRERGRLRGNVNINALTFASDLWAHDLVDGVRPPTASDPRHRVYWWAGGGAAALLAGCLVWRRRRV